MCGISPSDTAAGRRCNPDSYVLMKSRNGEDPFCGKCKTNERGEGRKEKKLIECMA